MELLDHVVILFLIFWGISILFSAIPFYISISAHFYRAHWFRFFHIIINTCYCLCVCLIVAILASGPKWCINDSFCTFSARFCHVLFHQFKLWWKKKKIKKRKEKIIPFFDFLSLQVSILSDVLGGKGHRKTMWFGVRWAPVHPSIHSTFLPYSLTSINLYTIYQAT